MSSDTGRFVYTAAEWDAYLSLHCLTVSRDVRLRFCRHSVK